MPIVTFTSDFGLTDYYAAVIKGALLSANQQLNIVDISHNVKTHDIVQGAFILNNAYPSFPEGTIHIVSVNNFNTGKECYLAVRKDGHYFLGADNGLFSLMWDKTPADIYELELDQRSDFPMKDVFAKAVNHITNEMPFNEIGIPLDEITQRISIQPIISPSTIKGSVIHVDNYENVIVNISKGLLERVGEGRNFSLFFKRHDPITSLSRGYLDVPVGEILCFINTSGYLEIAINMGQAASMLGLKIDDTVQIDFYE